MSAQPSYWPDDPALQARLAHMWGPLRLRAVPEWFRPTPKQEAFMRLHRREAFYGGAAGPGKSTALLAAALQYVDVPGYAALILRRTYTDLALPGALMSVAAEWLHGKAHWDGNEHTWTFPSGATLTFGHLIHEDVKLRYQSAAFQFIGLDELTHFTETMYRYMFSRVRRPSKLRTDLGSATDGTTLSEVPLRVRSASNPGGPGHEWVRARLVDPATRIPDSAFIPARLVENPYVDREEYEAMLAHLPEVERARLLGGNWDVRDAGEVFTVEGFRQVDGVPDGEPEAQLRVWDLAATKPSPSNTDPDWAATALWQRYPGNRLVIAHVFRMRGTPAEVEAAVKRTADTDGRFVPILIEQEPGAGSKLWIDNLARGLLLGWNVRGQPSVRDKVTRAMGYAAAVERGQVELVAGGPHVHAFLDEHDAFPNAGHDDFVDVGSAGFNDITGAPAPGRVESATTRRVSDPSWRRRR